MGDSLNEENTVTVEMADGKTFIFEEDDPIDERGIPTRGENLGVETTVKMQDGKTFIFEEDDMDEPPERGAVPPAGYNPKSMDHNSAEYMNLKMQALEETPTPVNPLPSAKTVSMRPIAQAEDLPADFEEDENIFAEADLAMEQMDELREQARAEELKKLEHQ